MNSSYGCEHGQTRYYMPGWRRCLNCDEPVRAPARIVPADRPHLVNGYYLSDSDYELVRGYRRERDRQINAAKDGYAAKLKALLELVSRG